MPTPVNSQHPGTYLGVAVLGSSQDEQASCTNVGEKISKKMRRVILELKGVRGCPRRPERQRNLELGGTLLEPAEPSGSPRWICPREP